MKGLLGVEIAVIIALLLASSMRAGPQLTSTTAAAVTQVGAVTTFESARAAVAVTGVPAGTVAGDVVLTFVETRRGARVTCTSGGRLILDRNHGAGTQVAGCMAVVGGPVPSVVRVRIWPRSGVAAVTMAFAGVDLGSPVDAMATSQSRTSPAVTVSAGMWWSSWWARRVWRRWRPPRRERACRPR